MNPIRLTCKVIVASVLIAITWWAFAPTAIGGWDSYFILSGTSMLPRFTSGDLVVVRRSSSYQIGSVAAYQTPQLHSPIMHVIVAARDGLYTFKGENNSFIDPSHPSKSEIIGKLWLDMSRTGEILKSLREPAVGAMLLGASGYYMLWPPRRRRHQRRSRRYGYGF